MIDIYITERTELSFWPSICCVGCRWVNQFEAWTQLIAKMVWECGGNWEWGKDSHVVHLHIVINFDHSSESEITNCQSCCKMQMLSSAGMEYKCGCQASQRYSYRERLSIVHARILALYPGGRVRGNEPRYKINKIYLGSLSFIFSSCVGAGKEAKW